MRRLKSYTSHKRSIWSSGASCRWCRSELSFEDATVDHVVPVALGGDDSLANLVLACESCNQSRDAVAVIFRGRFKPRTPGGKRIGDAAVRWIHGHGDDPFLTPRRLEVIRRQLLRFRSVRPNAQNHRDRAGDVDTRFWWR